MICSLFIFLMGWVVQGGLSSPLLDLRDGKTAAMQSMSLGKRTTVTRDKGAAQSLEVEERDTIGITAAELGKFKQYAQWAGASYCDPVAKTPVYCRGDICPAGGNENAMVYDVFSGTTTDILAFLAISPATSELILSVRGTATLANWLADVLWAREATSLCAGCEAHLGFLTAYSEIVGAVNASLVAAMARYPSYRITITGHSLGGAVATLLALHFRDALRGALMNRGKAGGGSGIALYTYGSPRVGNLALAEYVTQQQSGSASGGNFRVTHEADVVPRVPPVIEDYRHISPEYWLSPGPHTRTVYDASQVDKCDGYASAGCNAGALWWDVDVTSHLYYLVAISQCGENYSTAARLSFCGGGAAAVAGSGGQLPGTGYHRNGNVTGPVNGTTATNSSNATIDGFLTPDTTNTLAMYAKLDQEYMAAWKQTGGVVEPVF